MIDDESEMRTLPSKALTKLGGFQIDVSENGEGSLKYMVGDPFDLVLADLKTPKIDGLVLMRKNINRLTKIMNDLRSLSKIESGRAEMCSEEFSLRKRFEMTALQIVRVA
jgi:CheY-like chemotaxis protein